MPPLTGPNAPDGIAKQTASALLSHAFTEPKTTREPLGLAEEQVSRMRAEREQLRSVVKTMEDALLPTLFPERFPGLSVAAAYRSYPPEAGVGGDFYDTIALADGRVALMVGDASGKGPCAALRAAEARFALRAFLGERPDPAWAVGRLNDFLCGAGSLDAAAPTDLIALTLAVIEPEPGQAVLAGAGCEPPLVIRANGDVDVPPAGGPILGMQPGASYAAVPIRLFPGDTLMLLTDGITEARRDAAQFLGHDGAAALASQARRARSLSTMGRTILDTVLRFCGGTLHDDACLLLARRHD